MKDLIKVIEQESYEYSDPITGVASCKLTILDKVPRSTLMFST